LRFSKKCADAFLRIQAPEFRDELFSLTAPTVAC